MSKRPTQKAVAESEIDALTFEQALAELERLVERIEGGEQGLEQSVADYERGAILVKRCEAVLAQAEQRVRDVTKELADLKGKGRGDSEDDSDDGEGDASDEE
ncbi:MAG: exodeoxyribonuclease VII small subunit [Planctomycetota bacterium]|nr:exodeoxyribonuclease VII small subunit [Planctomycetota bacterium]